MTGNADYPRPFALHRQQDVTGVSGEGIVAHGTRFADGTVVIRWLGDNPSTVIWGSVAAAMRVHGHDGKTQAVWPDDTERLDRISGWHSRETGPAGMVGDFCVECGDRWPCDTRRMADGTYQDPEGAP